MFRPKAKRDCSPFLLTHKTRKFHINVKADIMKQETKKASLLPGFANTHIERKRYI